MLSKRRNYWKKSLGLAVLSLQFAAIFFPFGLRAQTLPTASDIAPDLIRPNDIGALGNSALSNLQGPRVSVQFDKQYLRDGEKVTAKAIPTGFATDEKELYFTWYLKRKNASDDENEWKVEAARIISQGTYDKNDANYAASSGDGDGYKAEPSWGDSSSDYCYVQDFKSGKFYELTSVEDAFSCPAGSEPRCVNQRTVSCADNSVSPPSIEQKSVCQENDKPKCEATDVDNFYAAPQCPSGMEARCVPLGGVFGSSATDEQVCSSLGTSSGEICSSIGTELTECSFVKKDNQCEHLFAKLPEGSGEKTGDGQFTSKEEEYWGTDPQNRSTAGNGQVDEANVVGLGISEFTWTYQEGDQVGVVIEGESLIPTSHSSAKKMLTWAFSKNSCSAIEDARKKFYIEQIYNSRAGILTLNDKDDQLDAFDVNDCLEENLIDPGISGIGNLTVNLSYTPEYPINDPVNSADLSRGDEISVQAFVEGAEDAKRLMYSWSVEVSTDGTANPETWKDVTSEVISVGTEGVGMDKLSFILSIPKDLFPDKTSTNQYIRVRSLVSEIGNSSSERTGRGEAVIKITHLDKEVVAYGVDVAADGKLSFAGRICDTTQQDRFVCTVVPYEIIGVKLDDSEGKVSNVSWTVDGKQMACSAEMSSECGAAADGKALIFPVVGRTGDVVEVLAKGVDSSTGEVIEVSRYFAIADPAVNIFSANTDTAWPRLAGFFKNPDGSRYPDYSEEFYETSPGYAVKFRPAFYPSWMAKYATYRWKVDGQQIGEDNMPELSFAVDKPTGSSIYIQLESSYTDGAGEYMQRIRKALLGYWGVSLAETFTVPQTSQVQLSVLDDPKMITPENYEGVWGANLITHLPENTLFLVRIMLSAIVLIVVSGVVFALLPVA